MKSVVNAIAVSGRPYQEKACFDSGVGLTGFTVPGVGQTVNNVANIREDVFRARLLQASKTQGGSQRACLSLY